MMLLLYMYHMYIRKITQLSKNYKKLVLLPILLSLFITLLFIFSMDKYISISFAQEKYPSSCNCTNENKKGDDICYDQCSRKVHPVNGSYDEAESKRSCTNETAPFWGEVKTAPSEELQKYFCSIKQPTCCQYMKKYGDNRFCCFQERFFCHPSLCIEDGKGGYKDQCGLYWLFKQDMTNRPEGYGCMKIKDGQMVSRYDTYPEGIVLASNTTQPTNTPTPTPTVASGQTPPGTQQQKSPVSVFCLKRENYYKPSCPGDAPCIDYPPNTSYPINNERYHNLLLTGSVPKNTEIYIVACIGTNKGIKCTAGSRDNNGANDKLKKVAPEYVRPLTQKGEDDKDIDINVHEFAVLGGNPFIITDANNKEDHSYTNFSKIAHSYTNKSTSHTFFAVFTPPKNTDNQKSSSVVYGSITPDGKNITCTGVQWDPKGRTFDAISLEPIPQSEVTLYDSNNNYIQPLKDPYLGITQNPYFTKLNGEFNFYVPNGIYYLTPKNPNYSYPIQISEINQNYTKAYYCDEDVGQPLYLDRYPIPEQNKLIHCDIPLYPKGKPYTSFPSVLTYEHFGIPSQTYTKFGGSVTHPLTIIELIGTSTKKVVAKLQADKLGYWSTVLDNSKIPQDETLELKLSKVSLTDNSTTEQEDESQLKFQPIPRFIEGYIYPDNSDTPIGNADVYIQSGDNKVKVGETDKNGFITIYPEQLPIMEYNIVAIPKIPTVQTGMMSPINASPITLSPLQFLKANKKYLDTNKINLLTAEKAGSKVTNNIYPKFDTQNKPININDNGKNDNVKKYEQTITSTRPPLALILVLFLFTATGIVGLVFYLSKKFKNKNDL